MTRTERYMKEHPHFQSWCTEHDMTLYLRESFNDDEYYHFQQYTIGTLKHTSTGMTLTLCSDTVTPPEEQLHLCIEALGTHWSHGVETAKTYSSLTGLTPAWTLNIQNSSGFIERSRLFEADVASDPRGAILLFLKSTQPIPRNDWTEVEMMNSLMYHDCTVKAVYQTHNTPEGGALYISVACTGRSFQKHAYSLESIYAHFDDGQAHMMRTLHGMMDVFVLDHARTLYQQQHGILQSIESYPVDFESSSDL